MTVSRFDSSSTPEENGPTINSRFLVSGWMSFSGVARSALTVLCTLCSIKLDNSRQRRVQYDKLTLIVSLMVSRCAAATALAESRDRYQRSLTFRSSSAVGDRYVCDPGWYQFRELKDHACVLFFSCLCIWWFLGPEFISSTFCAELPGPVCLSFSSFYSGSFIVSVCLLISVTCSCMPECYPLFSLVFIIWCFVWHYNLCCLDFDMFEWGHKDWLISVLRAIAFDWQAICRVKSTSSGEQDWASVWNVTMIVLLLIDRML